MGRLMLFWVRVFSFLSCLFLLQSCTNSKAQDKVNPPQVPPKPDTSLESHEMKTPSVDSIITTMVDVQAFVPGIYVELKYATLDNFVHQQLYKLWKKPYIRKNIAIKLAKAQATLKSINNGLSLLVYDAARPLSVQRIMWKALDSIPPRQRGKFVSNPANKSLHNFGCAVDLTICDAKGVPLDMGAGYDDIRTIAYPSYESYYLKKGLLTPEHLANRKLLRKVMNSAGFVGIPSEWWHFNGCTRDFARQNYQVIEQESDIFNK